MDDQSFSKRIYYRYLSAAYAFTYYTGVRTFLGASIRGWIKFLAIVLFGSALIFRWGEVAVGITAVFLVWVYLSYWRAKRAGYSKFIADSSMALPDGDLLTLLPNQKVPVKASGIFSVKDLDDFVLLQPAEYWQVALGDHVMMVRLPSNGEFRYQFFNARTLQRVQKGWLLFGAQPLRTLAITLLSEIGDAFAEQQLQFNFSGKEKHRKGVERTVYLSFADEADETLVWHNIVRSARKARQAPDE